MPLRLDWDKINKSIEAEEKRKKEREKKDEEIRKMRIKAERRRR